MLGLSLQPNFVIICLIAGLGPHLGAAEPPAHPVSGGAPRQRPGTPSTGRAARERARRRITRPGRAGRRACDHQVGAFPDAERRFHAAGHSPGRAAFRGNTPPGGAAGCRTLSWARRTRPRIAPGPPTSPRLPAYRSGSPRPRRLAGVAGLGARPNHVVARAAVPDAGARPSGTRPPRVGCHATGCGAVPRPLATPGTWGVISGIGT